MRYPHPKFAQLAEPARALAQAEYWRLREAGCGREDAAQLAFELATEWGVTRGATAESELDRPGKLRVPVR